SDGQIRRKSVRADGGKIKAKYTSRAADLYREILAKEVAKAIAEDTTTALPEESTVKEELPPRETSAVKHEAASSPKASATAVPKVAPVIPAAASAGSSYASEFEYNDGLQSGGQSSGGGGPNAKSISSAQYFGDQNKNADLESKATLQKFSGSISISSADFFGHDQDDSSVDITASDLINRLSFQAQQNLSSIVNIAGETKKLGTLASGIFSDLQDRMLREKPLTLPLCYMEAKAAIVVHVCHFNPDHGALTDPSPKLPLSKISYVLANRHMRISGFLAQSSLTCYLVKLTVDAMENSSIDSSRTKVVQSVAEQTEIL
ncbi:hypothetical protein F2Q69_00060227, partial [Brassica cretica]